MRTLKPIFLIELVLAAQLAPALCRADDCEIPGVVVGPLAAAQTSLFEGLGWANYRLCDDFVLNGSADFDVGAVIELARFDDAGARFAFMIERSIGGLQLADLDPELRDAAVALDFRIAVVTGSTWRAGSQLEVAGLAISTDDPVLVGTRHRWFIPVGHVAFPTSLPRLAFRCTADPDKAAAYRDCLDTCTSNYNYCLLTSSNNREACFINALLGGGGLGGAAGCVIGGLRGGAAAGGAPAIKALLAWCLIGAIVGIVLGLVACNESYRIAVKNCELGYFNCRDNCITAHCDLVPLSAQSLATPDN